MGVIVFAFLIIPTACIISWLIESNERYNDIRRRR